MQVLPTGLVVKFNFFYLLASCFFLGCNSLVRLSEKCDVVGHERNGNAESSIRIFLIGEGLICSNGV
jgi:hypothetical protein